MDMHEFPNLWSRFRKNINRGDKMEKIVVEMQDTKQWQRDEIEKMITMVTRCLMRAAQDAGTDIPHFRIVRVRS